MNAQSLIFSEKIRGGVMTAFDLTPLRDFQKKTESAASEIEKFSFTAQINPEQAHTSKGVFQVKIELRLK